MSEHSAPYGDYTPGPPPSITTRVDALEQRLAAIETAYEQHKGVISALVNTLDSFRYSVDGRLTAINQQLAAIQQSNQVLVELITSRLPPPAKDSAE